jgi:peptidoglycan/LPS O-acetylase OafA/YrhL
MLLEFILGAAVALLYARYGVRRKLGIVLLIVGAAAALYLRANPDQGGATGFNMILASVGVMRRVLTWGMSALMIVGGVIFWSPAIETRVGKVAVVLGNASYSSYLASSLIIEFVARALVGSGRSLSLGRLGTYQTLIVAAVFAGGWVCYQFVEWPMLRWLRSYSGERRDRNAVRSAA